MLTKWMNILINANKQLYLFCYKLLAKGTKKRRQPSVQITGSQVVETFRGNRAVRQP